jgi:16S rRNA (adenine1518-N6/adenine1519-N6)-dimethyltransferase
MRANKLLGQNFLTSQIIAKKIVAAADIIPSDTILEVGPGRGFLTQLLVQSTAHIIAIEKDPNLAIFLEEKFLNVPNIEILQADVLKQSSYSLPNTHYKVVANIPYYITSHFLRTMLEHPTSRPQRMVLMVQKEVADRIIAKPPAMSLLALSVQAFGTARKLFNVPKTNFLPQPEVDSAVIIIDTLSDAFFQKNSIDSKLFFDFIRKAFAQKRKMLRNSLEIQGDFALRRPQELSLEEWENLYLTFGKN